MLQAKRVRSQSHDFPYNLEELDMQIPGLRGLGPVALVKQSVKGFLDDDMTTYASALAYQVIFSLFPFVIFLIALLGFLHMPQFFTWLREQAATFLPDQAMEQVNRVIDELQQPQGGLLSLGIIVALWTASAGVRAVMNALNKAYDVRESRPAWKLYPLSILYTIGLAIMLAAAAAMLVVGPDAMKWLAQKIGLEQAFVYVWTWARWPVLLFLLSLAVAMVYYVAPNVRHRFQLITPGAVLAVLVWIGASVGFDYYLRNFADYSVMYGSVGTIIGLLLYFFISASVLLFGAEVNAVIERHAPEGMAPQENRVDQASGSSARA